MESDADNLSEQEGSDTQENTPGERPRYASAIEDVFFAHYSEGTEFIEFQRGELLESLRRNNLTVSNLPDLVYMYRSRRPLPQRILATGNWAIDNIGRGWYGFLKLKNKPHFSIDFNEIAPIDIYNAIPDLVEGYLRDDEQSLLTRVLYNRLVDIYTSMTCFLVQNHYRSTVEARRGRTEVEVDALYTGVNTQGELCAIPIEAKSAGDTEMLGRVQLSNMAKLIRQDPKFAGMRRCLLAIKTLNDGTIGMVRFNDAVDPDDFGIITPVRYRLVRRAR